MEIDQKKLDDAVLNKVAQDFSKYCDINLETKLNPVNQSIESMLTRLEEFQFMLVFAQKNCAESEENINSLIKIKPEFEEICEKIDRLKELTKRLTETINSLEKVVEKEEADLGIHDTATKVTNMLMSPLLFKRNAEDKRNVPEKMVVESINLDEYFN